MVRVAVVAFREAGFIVEYPVTESLSAAAGAEVECSDRALGGCGVTAAFVVAI